MVSTIEPEDFVAERGQRVLLDVRTPDEYNRAHIPGALNLPLFSNEERAEIGTIYKQKGPDEALEKGLDIVGPRMSVLSSTARRLVPDGSAGVHCWRGGKRSASVAWLLDFAGMDVVVMEGGYKAYRRWVLELFQTTLPRMIILGGRTGSGKTEILHRLRDLGEQVIDLEGLANHKGSAFGWIDEAPQPRTEHFENLFADAIQGLDLDRRVWLENESRSIGKVRIPDAFWPKMKAAPLINIERPLDERLDYLVDLYVNGDNTSSLVHSFEKITKRLGGQHVQKAVAAVKAGDYRTAAGIALHYYDKTYDYNLSVNPSPDIHKLKFAKVSAMRIATELVDYANRHIDHAN